jgi:RecJ-like exonuclease
MFMQDKYNKGIELVKEARSIRVYTHIDADGLSAGGILSKALERTGKDFEIKAISGIHNKNINELVPADLTIFSDLGSGQLDLLHDKFKGNKTIILDHHQVNGNSWNELVQVNPCLSGIDGSTELSGAGVSYFFAKALDSSNIDLSYLGVVGAVGDIQNFWGKFEGLNKEVLKDSIQAKVLSKESDLLLYGRHIRPVYKSMQYFTDPYVPGVSNSESGAIALLQALGIGLKQGESWRTLTDLSKEEKQKISHEFIQRAVERVPKEWQTYIPGLIIGEVYSLLNEGDFPELQGASEFSTCLNATGRNNEFETGLKIAQGERGESYKKLLSLLRDHRKNIAKALEFVENLGVKTGPKKYVQYFDAEDKVSSSIIGTIAGMILGSDDTDPYKPMVAFSSLEQGVKVSARCSRLLIFQNINMAKEIREAAKSVGGTGGGHTVACGAFIPHGKIEEFVEKFEERLLSN